MTTYNPVRPLSMLDKMSDLYYSSYAAVLAVHMAFFIGGCAIITAVVVAAAA